MEALSPDAGPSFLFLEKEGLPCRPWEPAQKSPPRPLPAPEWLASGGRGGVGRGQQHPPLRVSPRSQGVGRGGCHFSGQPCNQPKKRGLCPHRVEVRGPGPPEWRSEGAPVKTPERLSGRHSPPFR